VAVMSEGMKGWKGGGHPVQHKVATPAPKDVK
jgi:hypothetical protein